jgi:hypothetical protein
MDVTVWILALVSRRLASRGADKVEWARTSELLPADVHARFRRQTGCATGEHGTPAELAAAQAGIDVASYCECQHAIQADIYQRLNLAFDHFGRSSSPHNHALTQYFFARLEANGFIEEQTLLQMFSIADACFLPDRYVIGTCPGFEGQGISMSGSIHRSSTSQLPRNGRMRTPAGGIGASSDSTSRACDTSRTNSPSSR